MAQRLVPCLLIAPVLSFRLTALRDALSLWWVLPTPHLAALSWINFCMLLHIDVLSTSHSLQLSSLVLSLLLLKIIFDLLPLVITGGDPALLLVSFSSLLFFPNTLHCSSVVKECYSLSKWQSCRV